MFGFMKSVRSARLSLKYFKNCLLVFFVQVKYLLSKMGQLLRNKVGQVSADHQVVISGWHIVMEPMMDGRSCSVHHLLTNTFLLGHSF